MINSNFRKKMADSWFSYLQIQICKSFELLENNKLKFTKRDWQKNNLKGGGGISYLMTGGKIFDKVGVNKSTVSGTFPKKFRSKILGAEKKGTYWASGVSVVAHMKNPKIPALHFNTRFIVTSKEWFGGGMDRDESFDNIYKILRKENHRALLMAMEKEMIIRTLKETKGNQLKASEVLGISRSTLRKRVEEFAIDVKG